MVSNQVFSVDNIFITSLEYISKRQKYGKWSDEDLQMVVTAYKNVVFGSTNVNECMVFLRPQLGINFIKCEYYVTCVMFQTQFKFFDYITLYKQ